MTNYKGEPDLDKNYQARNPCCNQSVLLVKNQLKRPYMRRCAKCWKRWWVDVIDGEAVWKDERP